METVAETLHVVTHQNVSYHVLLPCSILRNINRKEAAHKGCRLDDQEQNIVEIEEIDNGNGRTDRKAAIPQRRAP